MRAAAADPAADHALAAQILAEGPAAAEGVAIALAARETPPRWPFHIVCDAILPIWLLSAANSVFK